MVASKPPAQPVNWKAQGSASTPAPTAVLKSVKTLLRTLAPPSAGPAVAMADVERRDVCWHAGGWRRARVGWRPGGLVAVRSDPATQLCAASLQRQNKRNTEHCPRRLTARWPHRRTREVSVQIASSRISWREQDGQGRRGEVWQAKGRMEPRIMGGAPAGDCPSRKCRESIDLCGSDPPLLDRSGGLAPRCRVCPPPSPPCPNRMRNGDFLTL